MVKIFIDEKPVEAEAGMTVFDAAGTVGIHIPHLCYHPAFEPEGTCRMCLIEIEGLPKLELACATRVREGMKVLTKTERVVVARKGVLEFLLAEHPMDCPICDQAGECCLQDYYEEYGLFEGRFDEQKERRQKKDKLGKNIIHDQERCVLCRRCVRFLREVPKTGEMGVFERGIHTEVNIFDESRINNNYSGNLAEICPVGALTDTDFRFQTRSWFLEKGASICPHCSRGCNIFVEFHRGLARFELPKKVYRIKARENLNVNKYWICDIGRYEYVYLEKNRLDSFSTKGGEKSPSINDAFEAFRKKVKSYGTKTSGITLVLSSWLSNEELYLAKKIFIDDMKVENVFFADPPDGESDNVMLTAERSPNRRGAREIGFDIQSPKMDILSKTDLLLVFRTDVSGKNNFSELEASLNNIESKFLFTAHSNPMDSLFDMVFPVPLIAEKSGTLTNTDGIIQPFSPVLEAPGQCIPEWKILSDLGKELGINNEFYDRFSSPEVILQELGKEISFFGKKSE